ncbi:hypothetical protein IC614_07915 [Allosphingosinicella flava]|uniref:NADH:quinone oxidoreductase/Mrp antiporter transmembrane domain-containing protein n=1 Tax=Allosphingosinicella flava TaxID=2771430 RepID=A0A7T2GLW4_9SPHN|nr:proton-conducting transporter membrane subunit [Sphingosinicella flava]QPQ56293.1 hypothetical protein IC614_07915 [Sphingosinicella flava]
MAILTLFVAAVVATFSLHYMRADRRSARFFALFGLLTASILVFLFTGNLIVMAVGWCASGQLLAALVGHRSGWNEARMSERRMRMTFMAGDAALLAGLGILALWAGSPDIEAVLVAASAMPASLTGAAAMLLVAAAAVRCALPPFSGWLLSSMAAPTPVSALMHAGLVNAGGFLLIRFAPILEAAPAARAVAVAAGLGAALYGAGIMMVRPDVKRALAGSTISQMGFMIMSCGLGAYAAALWHIIAHGLFKAALFLGSGSGVGIKSGGAVTPVSNRSALLTMTGTLAAAVLLVGSGQGGASLMPLLLGIATALVTLIAFLGGRSAARGKLPLIAGLAVLIIFHTLGLTLSRAAAGSDAPPLMPDWALLLLLAVFFGSWAWQQRRLSNGTALPIPLYVRLINAGTLTAGKGEPK